MSGRCLVLAQAGTCFQLPASTARAGDANQDRVSRPDRLQCTICSVVRSCARLLLNQLLVLVQVTFTKKAVMLTEIEVQLTSQKLVWQFRLAKAGRA
jgi:hypothetical protein